MKRWLDAEGRLEARRKVYWRERIMEMMRHALMLQVREHGLSDEELESHAARVAGKLENPYRLVPELVGRVFKS
jgi:hypothetical protein